MVLKSPIGAELITGAAELESLRADWETLWERDHWTTPFQSPQWLIPWCHIFAPEECMLLALRRRGRLVALFPWIIAHRSCEPVHHIAFVGAGVSDYQDALIENGMEMEAWQCALAWLQALPGRWICQLEQLPAFSPLLDLLLPPAWRESLTTQDYCPVLRLNRAGMADSIPAHQWSNVRYYRKRAEKFGRVEITCATSSTLPASLDHFFHLHAARWRQAGQDGVLRDPAVERFHRASAPGLVRAKLLRLFILHIDGEAVAALYGFFHRQRFYYYLGGYDPRFNLLSPGTLLIAHAIEQAIGEGAQEFDFLRGQEAYKYLWGARNHAVYRRCFWPRGAFSKPAADQRQNDNAARS
jgi:CelD/BcsL family acetyltransferase involved in cellulose biosynthesis